MTAAAHPVPRGSGDRLTGVVEGVATATVAGLYVHVGSSGTGSERC